LIIAALLLGLTHLSTHSHLPTPGPTHHYPKVLDDVTEIVTLPDGSKRTSHLESILLNGNQIALMAPGSSPEDAAIAHAAQVAGPVTRA
jgi:hypothetical protein